MKLLDLLFALAGTAIVLFIMALIMGFPTMWLWNYVMPYIFNLPTIDLYHAIGLNLLAGIFFSHNAPSTSKKE